MDARSSNGPRAFLAILGALAALAPSLDSGCGGSAGVRSAPAISDAGIVLGHVVTSGGGAFSASSSGGPMGNPFQPTLADDSGSTSDDSGSSVSDDASASSGDGSADGSDAAASVCDSYTPLLCGPTPCDLRSHTCCVTFSLKARCLAGTNAACASNEASLHCQQACECGGGRSCCGVMNTILGVVQTVCQSVPSGGNCQPYPQTVSQASAQICKASSECQNGQGCISQTCVYGANLSVCGLQSQAPFNCTAN